MAPPDEIDILLVEDNEQDAEMTLWALQKQRLAGRVHHVKDGEEALEVLLATKRYSERHAKRQPRVVLLDLKLPKVDGLEVLREIRTRDRTRMTPVVVLTSSGEDRDMVESYRLGVNSYIVKPIDSAKFQDTVRQLGLYWLLVNSAPS